MTQSKTIGITLRIDAKYKDAIDYLKLRRGALTRVVEDALGKVKVDKDLLGRAREIQEQVDKLSGK